MCALCKYNANNLFSRSLVSLSHLSFWLLKYKWKIGEGNTQTNTDYSINKCLLKELVMWYSWSVVSSIRFKRLGKSSWKHQGAWWKRWRWWLYHRKQKMAIDRDNVIFLWSQKMWKLTCLETTAKWKTIHLSSSWKFGLSRFLVSSQGCLCLLTGY